MYVTATFWLGGQSRGRLGHHLPKMLLCSEHLKHRVLAHIFSIHFRSFGSALGGEHDFLAAESDSIRTEAHYL